MILTGYLAFLDPPKPSAAPAIQALLEHGVRTKILTGDNEKVTQAICEKVGLDVEHILLGADIDKMTDQELAEAVESVTVFAKLSPGQRLPHLGGGTPHHHAGDCRRRRRHPLTALRVRRLDARREPTHH